VALSLLTVFALPGLIRAQESETTKTTRDALGKLSQQVQRNEALLESARAAGDTSLVTQLDLITSRPGAAPRPRTRGAAAEPALIELALTPDATMRVRDPNNTTGLILTGKWISDYARLIKLEPEFEKTLAGYRSQAELQKQLMAEMEGALEVKDRKIEVFAEMRDALQKRGDLYKELYAINRDSFLEKALRKLAFPAGVTVGLIVGAAIAN